MATGGRLARISIHAIKAADGIVVAARDKSLACIDNAGKKLAKIRGVWECPTGKAYVAKVEKICSAEWTELANVYNAYLSRLRGAAANYERAENANIKNERSNRDRYRNSGGGGR